jgi:hypothetical protein
MIQVTEEETEMVVIEAMVIEVVAVAVVVT